MSRKRSRKIVFGTVAHSQRIRLFIIMMSYALSGINLVCAGIYYANITGWIVLRHIILLGGVMLLMAPISILDKRREMQGNFAVVCSCAVYLIFCVMLALLFSRWWLVVCVLETLLCLGGIIIYTRGTNSRKRTKKTGDGSAS